MRRSVVFAMALSLAVLFPLAASAQPKGKGKGKGPGGFPGKAKDKSADAGSVQQLEREVARLKDQLREAESRLQRARSAEKSRQPDARFKGRPGGGKGRGFPFGGRPGEKRPDSSSSRPSEVERKLDSIQRQLDELRRELRRR